MKKIWHLTLLLCFCSAVATVGGQSFVGFDNGPPQSVYLQPAITTPSINIAVYQDNVFESPVTVNVDVNYDLHPQWNNMADRQEEGRGNYIKEYFNIERPDPMTIKPEQPAERAGYTQFKFLLDNERNFSVPLIDW